MAKIKAKARPKPKAKPKAKTKAKGKVEIGAGVKVYEPPDFGRQDAICSKIDPATNVIDAELVQSGRRLRNIKHRDDIADDDTSSTYWIELPAGYAPGSEGH